MTTYKHKYSLTVEFDLHSVEEDGSDALEYSKMEACEAIQSAIDKVMASKSFSTKFDLEDTVEVDPSDIY